MIQDKPRMLVTTALEESWPKGQPIIFLGEWCRHYMRKELWSCLDSTILPYHWDDRNKLYRNFQQLQTLNQQLLCELADKLNKIHRVNHSIRYWRLLLGYWLNLYTSVLYDRWEMIRRVSESGAVAGSLRLTVPIDHIVANNTAAFNEYIVDDLWNHYIYARLLEGWTEIPLESLACERRAKSQFATTSRRRRIKQFLSTQISRLFTKIARHDNYFFLSTYLPFYDELKLQWRLGQIPKFWRLPAIPQFKIDADQRRWRFTSGERSNPFSDIVHTLLPEQLPATFVEGYPYLCQLVKKLPFPRHPKLIFTSNNHFADDLFKAWAAEKIEEGSKLVIGEHGGYGTGLFNGGGSFQHSICDAFLSWGWDNDQYSNIIPVGILKKPNLRYWNASGYAVVVMVAMPRYSFDMRSMAIAGQMCSYFEDQFQFVEALPDTIQNQLLIRLYQTDYDWSQKKRWQDRCPQIQLDESKGPLSNLMAKSRILISTYNATSYLESLSINMPTVIFWKPSHWEIQESAIPYFEELKHVGIFHQTPESAARHVESIWDHVTEWWSSADVQTARECFCRRYAFFPNDLLERVEKAFREMIN